jgi:DNA (cytosine-5)-methyltransferase 1
MEESDHLTVRCPAVARSRRTSGNSLAVASFFSGIGGFDLGFQRAGYRITFQCEIDPFCNQILEQRWPHAETGIERKTNIKHVGSADIPLSDVWVGGFPCQDVSLARMGPRAGLRGARSGLFHEFARLLGESRPRVFVIENVPGLLSSHRGRDFGIIIRTLAELGYGVGWRVLNSKDFGVAQSRRRVYVVGCYRDPRGAADILFEPERGARDAAKSESDGTPALSPFKEVLGDPVKGPVFQRIAYCLYACSARHTGTDWSRTYVSFPDGRVRRLTPRECEGIQGFPVGWTVPNTGDLDPARIDTLRYTALGNAVTVNVAEWLARRISAYLAAVPEHRLSERDGTQNPRVSEEIRVKGGAEGLLAASRQKSRLRTAEVRQD